MIRGPSSTSLLYTKAITASATTSSTTRAVSRNARTCSGTRRPSSARVPSANAVSVDIATPQAWEVGRPALTARKTRAGTAIPTSPATSGSARRERSRRSPRSNSRRAPSPTTKKKNVMRPLLTQSRSSRETLQSPSRMLSSVLQKAWYDEAETLAHSSATSVPARRKAALPASVVRNRCNGVARLRAHVVVPVNGRSASAFPSGRSSLTRTTLAYGAALRQSPAAVSAPKPVPTPHPRPAPQRAPAGTSPARRQRIPDVRPQRTDPAEPCSGPGAGGDGPSWPAEDGDRWLNRCRARPRRRRGGRAGVGGSGPGGLRGGGRHGFGRHRRCRRRRRRRRPERRPRHPGRSRQRAESPAAARVRGGDRGATDGDDGSGHGKHLDGEQPAQDDGARAATCRRGRQAAHGAPAPPRKKQDVGQAPLRRT